MRLIDRPGYFSDTTILKRQVAGSKESSMQFKDAAYEIQKKAAQPLHHRGIAARAQAAGLLEISGQMPEATKGM